MSGQHEPNHPDEFASLAADMPAAVPDPSMEDILASIRRILNEEEAKPQADAADEPDVLELDHTMMLPDEDQPGHNQPAAVPESPPALVRPAADPVASVMAVPMPPPIAAPVRPMPTLVAPEAAAATAVSVGELMQTLATQRSRSPRWPHHRGSRARRNPSTSKGVAGHPPAATGRTAGAGRDRAGRQPDELIGSGGGCAPAALG
jgi:hypothetical protein